ncbi:hypothetical protein BCR39DRAFT_104868 [Naematelia encephala]|uniref:Zn(2)-C6 fungal-type domain-containing protein n=1 Tax=Naematelia encephala TaxID=71784 RepID=A0A1Y2B7E9_9TREE|nr:hypothetical protein BCR39DRAFT_104868 [Naematelia encephala]
MSHTSRPVNIRRPLSCAECRRLKIKCNLQYPCSNCVRRGVADICPKGELVNGSRRVKILASTQHLHDRIAALETALDQVTNSQHPLLINGLYTQPEVRARTSPEGIIYTAVPATGTKDYQSNQSHISRKEYSNRTHCSHGMDNESSSKHFGIPVQDYVTSHNARSQNLCSPFSHTHEHDNLVDIAAQYLPPEKVGRALAGIYFMTFGWYSNIVQRDTWECKFFDHVYCPSVLKPQRVAAVLLVFALGASMDLSRPSEDTLANELFFAARQCLALDSSSSVTYLQCIYLCGSFLMNGKKDTSGGETFWPLLRAGMGIVEAMGLHRCVSESGSDDSSVLERQIVFWSMHGYDVLQSSALGRGQCIADFAIDCAIPEVDYDFGFHAQCYKLSRIWSKINERQIRVQLSTYAEVSEIDGKLTEFESALPIQLSSNIQPSPFDLTDPGRKEAAFKRYMLLLYLNEARLALHRRSFLQCLTDYSLDPLHSPQKQSYLGCLEACRSIINLVRKMLAIHGQLINRRWHYLFHLFSACLCLATAVIHAPAGSLSQSTLSELDSGVMLFRVAQRDELSTLEELRDQAVRAMLKVRRTSCSPMICLDIPDKNNTESHTLESSIQGSADTDCHDSTMSAILMDETLGDEEFNMAALFQEFGWDS